MGSSTVPSITTPALAIGVPLGLTLRNTYTTTTSGLSFPVSQVYVIAVGGGGSGGSGSSGSGGGGAGGGGAVLQGWVASPTTVTVGASNGYSAVGALIAAAGGFGGGAVTPTGGGGGGAGNIGGAGGAGVVYIYY